MSGHFWMCYVTWVTLSNNVIAISLVGVNFSAVIVFTVLEECSKNASN